LELVARQEYNVPELREVIIDMDADSRNAASLMMRVSDGVVGPPYYTMKLWADEVRVAVPLLGAAYVQGLELRLPTSLRVAEFGSGTGAYPAMYRNAYLDSGTWKRLFADQDALMLAFGAASDFQVLMATDSNADADDPITWTEQFRVSEAGRASIRILNVGGVLGLGTATLASDTMTFTATRMTVDTEDGAKSDSLSTINGGAKGDLLILGPANDARTVVVKHNVGNIRLAQSDFTMDGLWDRIVLVREEDGYWYELSRSDNRA